MMTTTKMTAKRKMTTMTTTMTKMMTFNQAWCGPPPITTPLHHIQQITLFIIYGGDYDDDDDGDNSNDNDNNGHQPPP